MIITVVSDTHNDINTLNKVLELSKNSDAIFHLGDNIADARYIQEKFKGKVYMVKGNCDYDSNGEEELLVELQGKKFLLTHGHNYGVNYDVSKIYYRGLELGVNCVFFGHTHRKLSIEEEGTYIFNPGSASLARDGSNSIGYLEIENDKINLKHYLI